MKIRLVKPPQHWFPFTLLALLHRGPTSNLNGGASKEDRLELLSRIDTCASYDPWDLLDILTVARDACERKSNGQGARPSYLKNSSVPYYDLIIIDSLHNILNPYFGINGSESKSMAGAGSAASIGEGSYAASTSRMSHRKTGETSSVTIYSLLSTQLTIFLSSRTMPSYHVPSQSTPLHHLTCAFYILYFALFTVFERYYRQSN